MRGFHFSKQKGMTLFLLVCLVANSKVILTHFTYNSFNEDGQASFASSRHIESSTELPLENLENCTVATDKDGNEYKTETADYKTTYYQDPSLKSEDNPFSGKTSSKKYENDIDLSTDRVGREKGTPVTFKLNYKVYNCINAYDEEVQKVGIHLQAKSFGTNRNKRQYSFRTRNQNTEAASDELCLSCISTSSQVELNKFGSAENLPGALREIARSLYEEELIYYIDDEIMRKKLKAEAKQAVHNCEGLIINEGKEDEKFRYFNSDFESYSEEMFTCYEKRLSQSDNKEELTEFYKKHMEEDLNILAKSDYDDRQKLVDLIHGKIVDGKKVSRGLSDIANLPAKIKSSLDSMAYFSHHKNQIEDEYSKYKTAIDKAKTVEDSGLRTSLIDSATTQYKYSMLGLSMETEADIKQFGHRNQQDPSANSTISEWKNMLNEHYNQRVDLATLVAKSFADRLGETSSSTGNSDTRGLYDNSLVNTNTGGYEFSTSPVTINSDRVDPRFLDEGNGAQLAQLSNPQKNRKN